MKDIARLAQAREALEKEDFSLAALLYSEMSRGNSPITKSCLFLSELARKRAEIANSSKSLGRDSQHINAIRAEEEPKKEGLLARCKLNRDRFLVDIVVPVYNAIDDTKRCIDSLLLNRDGFDGKLIIVNDSSDEDTTRLLESYSLSENSIEYIFHKQNLGYTKAANAGLKQSSGDFVILLNSDTVVPPGWIQSIVRCFQSCNRIGIVGPLGNAATWQNVPFLLDANNQFAINQLPIGMTIKNMADLLSGVSRQIYPRVPFVNGFCFAVSRGLINKIGYLDDKTFPIGYGEENDYCIRARQSGYELAIADDCYVYHAKSKSFGAERKKVLGKQGREQLKAKHGEGIVDALIEEVKTNTHLDNIRKAIQKQIEQYPGPNSVAPHLPQYPTLHESYLFLLPVSGGGGGVHSIVQECLGMQSLGFKARIAVPQNHINKFLSRYSEIKNIGALFTAFDPSDIRTVPAGDSMVISTINTSQEIALRLKMANPGLSVGYYIQDYEPLFYDVNTPQWQEAMSSYRLINDAILIAKTDWICDKVFDAHGTRVRKVLPSIDHSVYHYDRNGKTNLGQCPSKIVISAMIRPKTPRRGAERTMRVLCAIQKTLTSKVSIHIFGTDESNRLMNGLECNFDFKNHGHLTRPDVAKILQGSDVFVDLSDYQAFGRTGLEAMACGSTVISTKYGGVTEYMRDGMNGILVDPYAETEVIAKIVQLCSSISKVDILKRRALATAQRFNIVSAALSEVLALSGYDF